MGDFTTEDDETVQVNLSNPTPSGDAILGDNGVLTIRDDDAAVSVSDVTVDEPVSGTAVLTFTVTLSHVNPRLVGFDWATSDGTAVAPGDYLAGSGSSTIAAGQLTRNFTVTVNADILSEGDETFLHDPVRDHGRPARQDQRDDDDQGQPLHDPGHRGQRRPLGHDG